MNAGNFSGSVDYTGVNPAPQSAQAFSGFQDATRGLLHLSGLNALAPSATTGYGYYPVNGNRLWAIEVDAQGSSLLLLEGVTP